MSVGMMHTYQVSWRLMQALKAILRFWTAVMLVLWSATLRWAHVTWLHAKLHEDWYSMTGLFLPLLSLCCRHALRDTYKRSFYDGQLLLPLSPCLDMPLVIAHATWLVLQRQAPSAVRSAENSATGLRVVDFTTFLFSLVLRLWVGEADGLIWAPVVIRLQCYKLV
jgi:hypothetical protein